MDMQISLESTLGTEYGNIYGGSDGHSGLEPTTKGVATCCGN